MVYNILPNYDSNDTLVHNNIADGTDRPTLYYNLSFIFYQIRSSVRPL